MPMVKKERGKAAEPGPMDVPASRRSAFPVLTQAEVCVLAAIHVTGKAPDSLNRYCESVMRHWLSLDSNAFWRVAPEAVERYGLDETRLAVVSRALCDASGPGWRFDRFAWLRAYNEPKYPAVEYLLFERLWPDGDADRPSDGVVTFEGMPFTVAFNADGCVPWFGWKVVSDFTALAHATPIVPARAGARR